MTPQETAAYLRNAVKHKDPAHMMLGWVSNGDLLALLDRYDELEGIVAKLPRSTDGVPLVVDMPVMVLGDSTIWTIHSLGHYGDRIHVTDARGDPETFAPWELYATEPAWRAAHEGATP
jgi:hypothetical protein